MKLVSPTLAAEYDCHPGTRVPLTDAVQFPSLGSVDVFGWFQDDVPARACMHAFMNIDTDDRDSVFLFDAAFANTTLMKNVSRVLAN